MYAIRSYYGHRLSAVVARLVKAKLRIGFAGNERARLFNEAVPYAQKDYELANVITSYSIHYTKLYDSGFLLRLFAGGLAFNVQISNWLFLSVFWLALYLVSGKRLGEIKHSHALAPDLIRPVLAKYPPDFLAGCVYISGTASLVTYTMYALEHSMLVYTVPLCCFGLLAFLFRAQSGKGGDPTWALLKDPVIFGVGITWVVFVALSIYTTLMMGE